MPHASVHEPAKPAEKDKADDRKEAKLVVGPDIKMKGVEVNDCDTLQVEGRIEATLDARVLQIAEKGVFSGTVAVDNAEIHGRLEGELTVRKQLVVHATGRRLGQDPLRAHQGRGRRRALRRDQRARPRARRARRQNAPA